jgi:hypothetical protein
MTYSGSLAQAGRQVQLGIGTVTTPGTPSTTFTHIGEVKDASRSGASWGTAETTNFDSGVDEEFITTTRNNGEYGLEVNAIEGDAGQVALLAAYDSGFKYDFQVIYPKQGAETTAGRKKTFSALVMSVDEKLSLKDAITYSIKLKVSGPITQVAGS